MAVVGTIAYSDETIVTPGTARGWKVGFGYPGAKGTVVQVYVVAADGSTTNQNTEIPKLANGKVDVNAVTSYLAGFGINLSQALKNVLGA